MFKTWFKNIFAERELYIRSQGRVRFITLTTRTQATASLAFIVTVLALIGTSLAIFLEDEIIAFRKVQNEQVIADYEAQISRLQATLTAMENKNRITQNWFEEVTNTIETRHNELTEVFEKHAAISSRLNDMRSAYHKESRKVTRQTGKTDLVASAGQDDGLHFESRMKTGVKNVAQFTLSEIPELSGARSQQDRHVDTLKGSLGGRIDRLFSRQQELLNALEVSSDRNIAEAAAIIEATRIEDIDNFIAQAVSKSSEGVGGPFIPVAVDDPNIPETVKKQLIRIGNNLEKLSNLNTSIAALPLARPVHYYKTTSDFGPRVDPINKRAAFHSGLDFGAPSGTNIHATLPGKVVKAGRKGPYGKVVEIDHGNGFRTRYGHMKSIKVKTGQQVVFHEVIGTVGSSGRSTGPHLHYEIWHNGKVKDPINFIRSGQHVFSAYLADTSRGK
ncbi:MAG: peptidoglycan DD-metalloendopeptidase family protein [Parvibaculales bacterium]